MDVAALGLRVDATGVDRATKSLESLTAQGARAEKSLVNVEGAASKTGASLKTMGDGSEKGLGAVARSADTAASSVQGFGNSAKTAQQSLREMQAQLTAANQTVAQMAAAMTSAVSSVQAAAKAQADATKSSQDLARSFQSAGEQVRAFSTAAQMASVASKESAVGVKAMSDAGGGLATSMGLAVRGVQAFMAMQVVSWSKEAASALYAASASAERLRISLDFSSAVGSAAEIAYLRKATSDLGLAFDSTAKAYQQFSAAARGTALEGEKARSIFESVAKASAVMGLSADQTSGVLLALQQMISKGTVQSEELRGQLGERLPGAFQTAARAMGVTTAELGKMLEQGKVVADDFLPKFAQELDRSLGDAAEKAANRLDAAINKFDNAWERLKQNAGDAGVSNAMANGFGTAAGAMDAMSVSMERARAAGSGFWGQAAAAIGTMYELGNSTDRAKVNMFDNAKAMAEAQKELDRLQKLAEIPGNGRWVLSEIGNVNRYIASLQQAKRERDAILGGGLTSAYTEGMGNNKTIAKEREKEIEDEKALADIRQRAAGINKQYFADLNTYAGLLERGRITQEQYVAGVSELAKRTWDSSAAGKEAAKTHKAGAAATKEEHGAYVALLAAYQAKIDLNIQEVQYTGHLNEAQKAEIKLDADIAAGKLKLSKAHEAELRSRIEIWKQQEKRQDQAKREVAMYQQQSEAAQQLADDYVRQSKAVESVRVASDKADQALREQLERMSVEESMIGRTTAARELAVAMLDAEIERRNALNAIDSNLDLNETVRQEQRVKVEERYALRVSLAQRKVYVTEWDKTSQLISDTLSDYIMRGGEDAAQYLKRLFATLVLQPVVQAVVGGLIGGGGAGGAAASSLLGSGGSGLVSNLIFGGMSLTTVGSSIGAGIMATLTGSSLGGAGAAGILAGGSSALGMLGGALPYLGAGLAVLKILSGDWFGSRGPNHSGGVASTATTDRDLAVKQVLGTDAWGNTLGDFTTRKNEALDKQLQKTVNGMLEMYKALAKIGGGGAREIDIAAGFSTNPKYADEGVYGYFQILDKVTGEVLKKYKNRDMDRDPEKAWAQFVADMGGELVNEIKRGDIPGWMREELDALGDNVTIEGLNAAIQKIAVIDAAFKGWADTVIGFANLTAKAQTELLKFSNGIEALANNVNAFYASFYSEQERAEILQRQVRDQLKKLGIDIDPAGGEAAKKAFRKLIEDALASGNNELAAKLLALAQLFGVAADAAQKSAEVAADAAKKAADEAQAAAEEMARVLAEERQKAKDAAMANFEAAVNREKEYWQGVLSSSQEAVQAITSILNPVKQAAKELFGSIESAGQMQAVQGMLYIERAIAGLRGGAKLSSFDGLTDAISAARGGITSGRYASQFERDRDALVLANQLSQIAGYGDLQLSVEERQLKNSQEQLQRLDKTLTYWRDLLDGNKSQIDATLSVEAAIKALEALLFPEKPTTTGGGGGGKTPTPDWGGGGGGFAPANNGKYKTPTAILGGGAVIYDYATPDYEKRLDSLAPTFEKYRGTGDFTGLAEDFRAAGGTARDLAYLYGFSESDVLAALDRNGIPRFDVGTNRVPQDMLAMVHKNEAIVPAAFNPWAGGSMGGGNLEGLVRQLLSEAVQSREERRQQAGEIVRLNAQIARLLQRWDGDGLPHEREEATA